MTPDGHRCLPQQFHHGAPLWHPDEKLDRTQVAELWEDLYTHLEQAVGNREAYMALGLTLAYAAVQSDRADNASAAIMRTPKRPGVAPDETNRRQPSEFDLSLVYARVLRDQSAGQQSGFVHLLQDRFGCSGWVLDGGGGELFRSRNSAPSADHQWLGTAADSPHHPRRYRSHRTHHRQHLPPENSRNRGPLARRRKLRCHR